MAGKGSKRRPTAVSDEKLQSNWERAFGKEAKTRPPTKDNEKAKK